MVLEHTTVHLAQFTNDELKSIYKAINILIDTNRRLESYKNDITVDIAVFEKHSLEALILLKKELDEI